MVRLCNKRKVGSALSKSSMLVDFDILLGFGLDFARESLILVDVGLLVRFWLDFAKKGENGTGPDISRKIKICNET